MHIQKQLQKIISRYFFWQSILAMLFLFLLFLSLNYFSKIGILSAVGVCSIGSSTFLVFVSPSANSAKAYHILISYLIAFLVGAIFHVITLYFIKSFPPLFLMSYPVIFSAVAMIFTMMFMVIFNTSHPPAAGFVIGLILDVWGWHVILILLIYILLLVSMRYLLKDYLRDLIS